MFYILIATHIAAFVAGIFCHKAVAAEAAKLPATVAEAKADLTKLKV